MRYVSFIRADGSASYGVLGGEMISDLGAAPGAPVDLKAALADGALAGLRGAGDVALADVTLLPPIPNPGKILCVGLNYASHIAETRNEDRGYPAIFTRWADTLVAHGGALIIPRESGKFDFEGELAVVIGKAARRVPAVEAHGHIAGYAVFHDGSIRDWQRHNTQFTPGKNFPATGSFGPALVTPDEIADLGAQRVQTRLNGALVQDQPVSDMIHDVAAIIAYISSFTLLNPGDVIATGTPGGVGAAREPKLWMQPGDRVEVSIGEIGTLANPVVAEG